MKTIKSFGIILAGAFLISAVTSSSAADRYNISFSNSGKTTNEVGALVNHPLSRSIVLGNISRGTGIPTSNLAVIYDRNSGDISVVDRDYGTNIFNLLRLETELSVGNTNRTKYEVFMKVGHPDRSNFDGSAVAQVTIKRDSLGEETGFKMTGKIHVAVEEEGVDTTAIYTGVFSTSSPFVPRLILP